MRSLRRRLSLAALLAGGLLLALGAADAKPAGDAVADLPERSGRLNVARIQGSINPASSDYLQKAIAQSEEEGAVALLLELDTPGGLVASTKDIIQAMLNSDVPIIVFVAPRGAWAGSAGTFITMAGHVAAMAPGSSIGAAHPVGIGGGGAPAPKTDDEDENGEGQAPADYAGQKAENMLAAFIESIAEERERNVEWAVQAVRKSVAITADKALELNVIDIVAKNRTDLLAQIEERAVKFGGDPVRLAVADAPQHEIAMSALTRFINVLVDPNVATLLLMAGLVGLYIEFNQPGMMIPGIVGAVCLLLALIAMQVLPFSWLGLLLVVVGVGLFVAEIFVTSYGALFAAGGVCLLLGGSMLFDKPELSDLNVSFWSVLFPAVATMAGCAGIVVFLVGRAMTAREVAGVGELIGMVGVAETELSPRGTVMIHGERWAARSVEPIPAQERVETVEVNGLELTVRRAPPEA